MFKMNVKREGTWMTLKQIKNQLTRIETEAGDKDVKLWNERPSLLTSETRNVWNKNRKLLLGKINRLFNHCFCHICKILITTYR